MARRFLEMKEENETHTHTPAHMTELNAEMHTSIARPQQEDEGKIKITQWNI